MIKRIKPYMMPIAMTLGTVFYQFFSSLAFLTPYLIFAMLFLTYSKLNFNNIRLLPLHFWLILIQVLGSLGVYLVVSVFNATLAQGVMICVLAPTATAAAVITGMLNGKVATVATYSLLSNLTVALVAPVVFSFVGNNHQLPFFESFIAILKPVFVLLFFPFAIALFFQKYIPVVTNKMGQLAGFSFYLWTLALCIVTGRTVGFILQQSATNHTTEIQIAVGAFVVCLLQFLLGRRIGRKYDDTVAGGQGLGQKNTILAIWMAQMYLNPIASIGPGAYVLWQNMINSYQVWRKRS